MLFATDCCFWMHIKEIYVHTQIDLRTIFSCYKWGITNAVHTEMIHFQLEEFVFFSEANLIPMESRELEKFIGKHIFLKEFDLADQSLLYTSKRDNNYLLTDDGGLFLEAQAFKISTFNVPLFCIYLVRDGQLHRKTMNLLFKYWDEYKYYSAKKISHYRKVLNNLQEK